jgi:hypothetical protein
MRKTLTCHEAMKVHHFADFFQEGVGHPELVLEGQRLTKLLAVEQLEDARTLNGAQVSVRLTCRVIACTTALPSVTSLSGAANSVLPDHGDGAVPE